MSKQYKVPPSLKKRRKKLLETAKKARGATQKGKPSKTGTQGVTTGDKVEKASTAKPKVSRAGKALAASALAEAVRRKLKGKKKGECATFTYKGKKRRACKR